MDDLREAMLEYARKQFDKLQSGAEFSVEDLFEDFSWRDIPLNHRISVGLRFHDLFFDRRDSKECESLVKIGKTEEEQQIYKRK